MPDFKTIADFRKDNGEAIGKVCREFLTLCRRLELFSEVSVAIDGSKFKAVNAQYPKDIGSSRATYFSPLRLHVVQGAGDDVADRKQLASLG